MSRLWIVLLALLAAACASSAPAVGTQSPGTEQPAMGAPLVHTKQDGGKMQGGPDYRFVSFAAAEALVQRGELVQLLLLPTMFGGSADPRNVVLVPPFVVEEKARIDGNIVAPLVGAGAVRRYTARPRYQGESVVPIAIVITASDPEQFTAIIKIWGDALEE